MLGLLYRSRTPAPPFASGPITAAWARISLTAICARMAAPSSHATTAPSPVSGEIDYRGLARRHAGLRRSQDALQHGVFGTPDRAVDAEKCARVRRAASDYARRAGILPERTRFDIVSIGIGRITKVDWIRDAFARV